MAGSDSHSKADRGAIARYTSRRRFLTAASVAGVTTTVAGCIGGGDDDPAAPDERPEYNGEEVTVEWSTAPLFGNEEEALQEALSDAGLHQNITVDFTTTVWGADDLQDRYNQILSAGRSTPDFMLTNFAYTGAFAPRGWLMDMTNVLTDDKHDELENDYHQTMVDAMRWDGGIYGIPLFVDIPTILYRKDLIEAAGYDPEGENWATEPMSWNEFSQIVSDAKERHGADHGYTTTLNQRTIGHQTGYEKVVTYGGNYFGDMSNQHGPIGDRPITIDEEPIVEALRAMRTMMHGQSDEHAIDGMAGDILPAEALGWDTTPSTESFEAGEAIAHRNWSYAIADFGGDDGFGENLGAMPFPYGATTDAATYDGTGGTNATLGGWHLSVNPNTENLAATLEVIDAMTSDEFYLRIFELTGSTPPKPELYESDRAQDVDVMNRYLDTLQLQSENQWVHPINQVWDLQREPISEQFHACLNRETSPEDAVAAAQDQVEQIENQHT
ncbi:ABC transporter substrate-binding protein [Natrinema salifodinae]|uniref:ABC-type glycerol-3-phosphate transport system, substrate-binding protein n=1 Tax=Natrinema salifodinae TaxID=1202768 RepID=A0A1I0QVG1_9EURY|nr:extracellular solute-binding protein [Natrinema salifodinae]SEW31657.1 ABC-type glycerol-3-phosphate transport system, substrate-binding protein [Natrinema salifodinae]